MAETEFIARRRMPPAATEARFVAETFRSTDAGSTVEVVVSVGAPWPRMDWMTGERYIETLDISPSAIRLGRLNGGAPFLVDHNDTVDNIIGVVERAWVTGGELRAEVRFGNHERAQDIAARVRDGIVRNVSCMYATHKVRVIPPTDGRALPERRAVDWEPMEVSLVAIPVDPGAGVRAAVDTHAECEFIFNRAPGALDKEPSMADTPNLGASQDASNAAPVDAEAERRSIREAEIARATEIRLAGRALGFVKEAEEMITEGLSVLDAQRQMILAAAEVRKKEGTPNPAHINVVTDEGDTKRAAMAAAIQHRAGVLKELPAAAREYRGMNMLAMAAECVEMAGGKTRGMTPSEIALAALNARSMRTRAGGPGMHTTSDFPNLLANTAAKALGDSYGSARRSFTVWARRRTLPDFKSFRVINLSGAPQLQQIAAVGQEAGEITFGTIGEQAEAYQLFRAGRRIAITFEAIVNDDMDGFSRVPQLFGTAAARLESETVYSILNTNGNMSDSNALFGTAHANVFGNGVAGFSAGDGVLSITGLGVGRRVMRTQTAPNGDIIDATARYLLVPAALETAAQQLTTTQFVPNAAGSVNPFTSLVPVVEPRLASAIQWYLIADNAEVDTVEYAYLEGMEAPQVTTYTDDDTDGVIVKCTHNFGAKATDWRGMTRSSGT